MKTRTSSAFLFATLCALAAPMASRAGVKYWDNPAFKAYDVGDYVQDGLVLHYDGIRNTGAGADHSTTTDTWVNLASEGAYPLTWCSWISSDSKYQRARSNTTQGSWEENGFHFNGRSVFATEESENLFSLPETYTMQFAMTAALSEATGIDGSGYLFMPGKNWTQGSVGVRNTANGSTTPANAVYTVDNARFNTNNTRPNFTDATPRYATVLGTSASLACFEGTAIPEVGTTYTDSCRANVKTRAAHANNWIAFGAQYYASTPPSITRDTIASIQGFNGTLHAIRYYSRALGEEELAWNRVIDEARFFGASAPIPVTNVVVATSAEGVEGDQPCGAYALDAGGYTFTAPAQRIIKGMRYVLGGYTLETWNGSGWGAAQNYDHETSCTLTDTSAKVRLTWQYAHPAGEGKLVVYDIGDYVTDGLLLHYDGILNVGADAAHDPDAGHWKNIAPGYESRWEMDWCSYTESSNNSYNWHQNDYTEGEWADNGFAFTGKGYFAKWNTGDAFPVPTNFTMQFLVTGAIADQLGDPAYVWMPSTGWQYGSVAMRKSNLSAEKGNANSVYYVNKTMFPAPDDGGSARPNFYPASAKPSYVSVITDFDNRYVYAFDGTSLPAAGGYNAPAITGSSPATNLTWFSVGGFHGRSGAASNLQSFKGTLHSVRFYNRILTDAELLQNRAVDNFRFFGPSATNVIVASTYSYLQGYDACGPYEVDGSYTFAAPESVTIKVNDKEITYACDGYVLETWNGKEWVATATSANNSYSYTGAENPVRITWKWRATRGLRTADDYDFDDYSPAGLRLHYDGLLNAGVGVAQRSTTATKWVNLGSDGAAMDLTLNESSKATSEQRGRWTDDGFRFGGLSQFESARIPWGDNFTAQCLSDIDVEENAATNTVVNGGNDMNVFATTWNRMSIRIFRDSSVRLDVQSLDADTGRPRFKPGKTMTFLTATEDASARTATVFGGVMVPTNGTHTQGFASLASTGNVYTNVFRLGGWGGNIDTMDNVIGTIKNFRYYDRVLTEEELVRNRNVDAKRYFGELGVTNMVVEVEAGSGITATPAAGAYFVEGSYDFSAERNGGTAALGYKIQEWDEANGEWVTESAAETASLSYSVASPAAAKKRLVWYAVKPFVLIVR